MTRGSMPAALILSALLGGETVAQVTGEAPLPAVPEASDQPPDVKPPPSIQTSLDPYLGPDRLRGTLDAAGLTYSFTYIGEVLGNVSGGQRRSAIYQGRLDAQFDLDLEKAFGWSGATLHTNIYQIHGHGLSRHYLGNLLVTSGIEALASTRLYELWLEQQLFDKTLSLRAGQLAADTEFVVSQYGALFVNSTFGFPALLGADLPNGGPAYPLATPGIRAKYSPSANLSASVAVFNGAPAGLGPGDPQINNRSGLEFRARDPALVMGEVAYSYDLAPETGLPGTVKLGGWAHLGRFDDPRFAIPDEAGRRLLADPQGSGAPRRLRGNGGGYVILDQLLHREPGTADQGLGMFVRLAAAPDDRNFSGFYADGGLTYKGLIPGRQNDTLGLSFAYLRVSDAIRGFDRDVRFFVPEVFQPIRSSEALAEITYQAEIVPGWTVQPDLQYIRRPGGGVVNPRSPTGQVAKDAIVAGVRSSIRY